MPGATSQTHYYVSRPKIALGNIPPTEYTLQAKGCDSALTTSKTNLHWRRFVRRFEAPHFQLELVSLVGRL
jgi:hypothetical protein